MGSCCHHCPGLVEKTRDLLDTFKRYPKFLEQYPWVEQNLGWRLSLQYEYEDNCEFLKGVYLTDLHRFEEWQKYGQG